MAYMYDEMGNIIGEYESDEERRRREQEELANKEVSKTEIKTYGDGSQEQIVKTQIEAPVKPTVAVQPAPVPSAPVAQPVSPDQTFNRMVQVESGGRQFDSQGRVLTSPAGAQGIAQIMPATARAPGFGVAPATPEEIATPEGNRAFGERYYQGLLKHFNGDVAKATAAYNAGPGAVQKNVQANQGQMNVAQLPQETQGYLQKVLGGAGKVLNAVIPSAQAGTLTEAQRNAPPTISPTPAVAPAPAAPTAPAETPAVPGTGLRLPSFATGVPTTPTTPDTTALIDRYQSIQDSPLELLKLRADETAAPWMRERAGKRAAELLRQEENKVAAEERAQTLAAQAAAGDPKASREMAKELQNKEGSWVKMILLGFLSPDLAGQEAMKLGFGNKDRTVRDADGNIGMVTYRADGSPVSGIKADGTAMSKRELLTFTAGGTLGKGASLSAEVYVDQTTGQRYRSGYDSAGNAAMVNVQGGGAYKGDPRNLTLQSIGTAQTKADIGLITDLKKKHGGNVLDAEKDYVSINGPFKSVQDREQFRSAYGFGLAQPATAPTVPAGAPTTPSVTTAAPVAPTAPTTPSAPAGGAPAAPTAPVAPGAVPPAPTGGVTVPLEVQKQGLKTKGVASEAEAKEFVKYDAEDIGPKSNAGSSISGIRKAQIKGPDGILNNPELAGILQGQGGAGAEAGNIIRDLVTGNFKDEADLSRRVAALNLSQRQKDVLYTQIGLNLQVAPLTLKQNAGAGSVSDAEQKANREANVDITRQPLYSGLTLLTRDQFDKDLQVARSDFKNSRPDLDTRSKFDSAWNAEKARASKEFDAIYAARAKYISKYNADGKNPGAIIDAYKHYPVPEWDREKRQWTYGTSFAEQAAKRPPISSFQR